MRYAKKIDSRYGSRLIRLGGVLAVLLCLCLVLVSSAMAGFEQVASFAASGEGKGFLRQAVGIAVNYTGAGGAPAGTFYGASVNGGGNPSADELTRWSPTGEFRAAWGWEVSSNHNVPNHFERCGPDGEIAHPTCGEGGGRSGEGEGQFARPDGVAVDESTGYVYVLNAGIRGGENGRVHNLIEVFSADGSKLIAEFGDKGAEGETIEQGPEKLHAENGADGIAVDASGDVYVADGAGGREGRIMVWRPQSPGDYEHYVYAGRASDISGSGQDLSFDQAGNLYRVNPPKLEERRSGESSFGCLYEAPGAAEVTTATVDPASGGVFYTTGFNKPSVIHQSSACDAQGEFSLIGQTELSPKLEASQSIGALAFNPVLAWGGTHPEGVLYAADTFSGRGYVVAPAEAFPPAVESQSTSMVTASDATLGAQIDPKGYATSYLFQYETAVAYEANDPGDRFAGAAESPLGGGVLPGVQGARSAAAAVTGLEPDTAYRFRVIATSGGCPSEPEEKCEVVGEAESFQTFPAGTPLLPDGRGWELVSPVEKYGGEPFPLEPYGSGAGCSADGCKPGIDITPAPSLSSPDGEAVTYQGFPFSEGEGAAHANQYLSLRSASGWRTIDLSPAAMSGSYDAFDAGLTQGVLFQGQPSLTATAPGEYSNLYAQPTSNVSLLTALTADTPPDRESGGFSVRYAGASADMSRVFFEANDALTGETGVAPAAVDPGSEKYDLYEWHAGGLSLVNVLPGNSAVAPGAGFGAVNRQSDVPHAISANGSVVFWSDEAGRVYARIDGERTVEVHDPGTYLTASADGSRVLLSDGCLYVLAEESCEDLTQGDGGFEGISGISEDLSHIYFVDTQVLAANAGAGLDGAGEPQHAQTGADNLYSWSEGQPTFVATLVRGDAEREGAVSPQPATRTAEASPHGRFLAFQSESPLTGYDNTGPTCVINTNGTYIAGHCEEALVYDSASGRLVCASCNPTGSTPIGPTRLPRFFSAPSYMPQPRYLTDSGRLFFDSQDALSPLDMNRAVEGPNGAGGGYGGPSGAGAAGAEDVYEYEPDGVGNCVREPGCVALISGGQGSQDSNFLAMDASGWDVFFTTRERLVPQDHDELMDVYDAREGGGFPPVEREAECLGEACQPAAPTPLTPSLASMSFEGAGNLEAAAPMKPKAKPKPKPKTKAGCTRGKHRVRVHGRIRCVKKRSGPAAKRSSARHTRAAGTRLEVHR
jgi:hypothetical protein